MIFEDIIEGLIFTAAGSAASKVKRAFGSKTDQAELNSTLGAIGDPLNGRPDLAGADHASAGVGDLGPSFSAQPPRPQLSGDDIPLPDVPDDLAGPALGR